MPLSTNRPAIRTSWRSLLTGVAVAVSVGGCGGGGGGGSPSGDSGSTAPGPTATGPTSPGPMAPAPTATGPAGTGPSASGAPAGGGGPAQQAVTNYSVTALTPYDGGDCHSCVNATGQAAYTVLHAGRIANFFNGTAGVLLASPQMDSYASGLNDAGQVAGGILVAPGMDHAARWTPGTNTDPAQPLDLGAPDGGSSNAAAINAAGQVAGTSVAPINAGINAPERAFLWTEGTGRIELGDPPAGFAHSHAAFLNDAGQVAGALRTAGRLPTQHAFVWSATGGFRDVGTLGGPESTVNGLNAAGQAAGQADLPLDVTQAMGPGLTHHAFSWSSAGGLVDLGTLGGRQSGAAALNGAGQVVGVSDTVTGDDPEPHAFLWSSGALHDLGTLGGTSSAATAINDAGQAVGQSTLDATGRAHAFLWTADQGLVDLNTRLGATAAVELIAAYAIARNGAILALTSGHELVVLRPLS